MFNENINKKLIIFIYNIQLIIKQTKRKKKTFFELNYKQTLWCKKKKNYRGYSF